MKGRVSLKFILMFFALVLFSWSTCYAGPGTVEVQTVGGITVRIGGQVRIIPTSEINRDFGLSNQLSRSEDARAAQAMLPLGNLSDLDAGTNYQYYANTRAHLNEGAGDVKDDYIRTENRLFFNFARKNQWSVYMALEMDSLFDRGVADRTDFAEGKQSQQFGIERLLGTINLPWISSQLEAGWDVRGVDVGYGGLVYGDDDPGIGIVGSKNSFDWAFWYIKKDEKEAGYAGTSNPLKHAFSGKDEDRTFYYVKVGYKLGSTYLQGFYFLDRNYIPTINATTNTKISRDITRHFIGLNYKGSYGIIKPIAEIVYCVGDYNYNFNNTGKTDKDINSFAAFADVAVDLHQYVSLNSFEVHVGGYYLQGDADQNDNKLNGFAPAVGITRFTPRFGSEQSISFDGNPILGQTLYSMFPCYFGTSAGASINGKGSMDNPGFWMLGGGLKAGYGKWYYNTHIMAMWFNQSKAVEYYFSDKFKLSNVHIHPFMGIEWNNEICYKIYQNVAIKGGAAFLFPGHGAKDITKALDAYGRLKTDFNDGRAADDVSMRFAAELLWFF